ncbi:phage-like protein [Aliiroseovarius zhejiangensis]|uniref:Phage-like protein n=1 Tax=Aliiroseovarius zhejiangensis TaxID=1632025 RepID=A0ABQ3IRD5_9RHOB|nr:hypothetical protein [Aliiroseovarius zhejiangensis]GHE88567.1 phage-like protein [Aliiroseovarius zhejiangensis]
MTDRPIIFSAPMIRAILEGRKTQTRRVMTLSNTLMNGDAWSTYDREQTWDWVGAWVDPGPSPAGNPGPYLKLPFLAGDDATLSGCVMRVYPKIQPGTRLWVREAHYLTDDGESEYAVYAADQGDVDEHLANMQATMASWPNIDWSKHLRLRPSIHMPRWASRLTLVVDDVRVQRLQDISEADAIAEGCPGFVSHDGEYGEPPREDFHDLWNSINGPDAWDANPWVFALTFTPHNTNIDQMEQDQ